MEEALDSEIGRFMTATGLATSGPEGQLIYNPSQSNTYVIFVTDNGSLGSLVKPPFDRSRAKSTAYQTGVWVPAIVAGPGVVAPGRQTDAMVNIVDIYQLIGELAGINVHHSVQWVVDSNSMLPTRPIRTSRVYAPPTIRRSEPTSMPMAKSTARASTEGRAAPDRPDQRSM
jgi:hypothetical protein